jgi:hypothetical protein
VPVLLKTIVQADETVMPLSSEKRDSEILRLWDAKWTARKIGEYLGIKTAKVGYVVHKNGRARKPYGPRNRIVVSLQEAPIEAWQQVILPDLKEAADAVSTESALKRAFVFACLLRMKMYDDIEWFIDWASQVTVYERDEIATFVERGVCGHLIVNGQPNDEAFRNTETEEGGGYIAMALIACVFEGTLERTVDDRYSIAGRPTHTDTSRWENDGGRFRDGA